MRSPNSFINHSDKKPKDHISRVQMNIPTSDRLILVTGGARSGKSAYAEQLALSLNKSPYYIATAEAFNDEMQARIEIHQARRGPDWTTIHAPLDLEQALISSDDGRPRLVDCLTIWLNNLIYHEKDLAAHLDRLCATLNTQRSPVIMVTNEVGSGIVPMDRLARQFRDSAGEMNQMLAQLCDAVYVSISGLPLRLK